MIARHQERCNGSCQSMTGCDCYRPWPDTISVYGDENVKRPRPMPVVPCSTLARWWLAFRRFLRD